MPIQSFSEFMDCPEGTGSTDHSQMEGSDSSLPINRTSTISHMPLQDKFTMQTEGDIIIECMFCDQRFKHHEELGKHVFAQHKATQCEPAVLRVEAEYLSPQDKSKKSAVLPVRKAIVEDLDCMVCGQSLDRSVDQETHMKKHKDSYMYCCNVCGRRFKEPWFLKNHKRTHTAKSGGKNKLQPCLEMPITINDVEQEKVTNDVTSSYKLCMVCGFMFSDKESLIEHIKIHDRNVTASEGSEENLATDNVTVQNIAGTPKEEFMSVFNLEPAAKKSERSGKWIPALDPFNTYQAWQLATKGKVAVGQVRVKDPLHEVNGEEEQMSNFAQNNECRESDVSDNKENINHDCEVPYSEGEKFSNGKNKPTFCNDCGKFFKTYHQLVLHSRIHRKDRTESESSSSGEGVTTVPVSPENQETSQIDKSEEIPVNAACPSTQKDKTEEDTKVKSEKTSSIKCSYCRKSFQSNYYINIHFRTHTGEKPYVCEFCDYAAAQKTSLRYHLERHHKFKKGESNAQVKEICKRLQLAQEQGNSILKVPKSSKKLAIDTKDGNRPKKAKKIIRLNNKLKDTGNLFETQRVNYHDEELIHAAEEDLEMSLQLLPKQEDISLHMDGRILQGLNNFTESDNVQENNLLTCEASPVIDMGVVPINLSLKPAEVSSLNAVNRSLLATSTCPYCSYKTLYPELLTMHQKLIHKPNHEFTNNNKNGRKIKTALDLMKCRRTGCPPALKGVDVSSMITNDTKSKNQQPKTVNEKVTWPPLLPNPGVNSQLDCKSITQNTFNGRQNGAPFGRFLQPDLQGISHLLERMQQAEQRSNFTNGPSTSRNNNTNGHTEYQRMAAWANDHALKRTFNNPPLKCKEHLSKKAKKNVSAVPTNYLKMDMTKNQLHPRDGNVLIKETSHLNSASSVLSLQEVDTLKNIVMASHEHQTNGPANATVDSSQIAQNSTMEVKRSTYQRFSKRVYGPKDKRA